MQHKTNLFNLKFSELIKQLPVAKLRCESNMELSPRARPVPKCECHQLRTHSFGTIVEWEYMELVLIVFFWDLFCFWIECNRQNSQLSCSFDIFCLSFSGKVAYWDLLSLITLIFVTSGNSVFRIAELVCSLGNWYSVCSVILIPE